MYIVQSKVNNKKPKYDRNAEIIVMKLRLYLKIKKRGSVPLPKKVKRGLTSFLLNSQEPGENRNFQETVAPHRNQQGRVQ